MLRPTGVSPHSMATHRRQPTFRAPPAQETELDSLSLAIGDAMASMLLGGEVVVKPTADGTSIEIVRIVAGVGACSAIYKSLQAATKIADEHGTRLVLAVDEAGAVQRAFYSRFGFMSLDDSNMVREPGAPGPTQTGNGERALALHRVLQVLDRVGREPYCRNQVGEISEQDVNWILEDPELAKIFHERKAWAVERLSEIAAAAKKEVQVLTELSQALQT